MIWGESYEYDSTGTVLERREFYNNYVLVVSTYDLDKYITPKTKWLFLNSPSNPTGSVYSKEELMNLGQILLKYPNIYILTDDI